MVPGGLAPKSPPVAGADVGAPNRPPAVGAAPKGGAGAVLKRPPEAGAVAGAPKVPNPPDNDVAPRRFRHKIGEDEN